MPGVLEGIRVIDFGQYIAGPLAAMLLGDHGADVIRVDPPGGPRWKIPANATWNRNKRSIVLDLKADADVQTARQLIASADVVIENFRPGVMDRLGVGADAMTSANPRLIYCSLPGFGSDDPRAQVRGWEGVVGAATGAYRASHASNGQPVYTVIPYGSAYAAFLCAVTVAMALNERERSGLGQRVEIPLFDATFSVVGARGLLVNGKLVAEPEFNWSRQLPCKDGRWLMYVANNKRFEAFIKAIGMDKWRDANLPPKELAAEIRRGDAHPHGQRVGRLHRGDRLRRRHLPHERGVARASAGARVEDHRGLRRSGARPLPRPRHQHAAFEDAGVGALTAREARCASRGDPARAGRQEARPRRSSAPTPSS